MLRSECYVQTPQDIQAQVQREGTCKLSSPPHPTSLQIPVHITQGPTSGLPNAVILHTLAVVRGSLPAQKAGGKMFATSARSHLNGAPELPAPRGAGHAQNAHEAATLARFKKEVTPALLGITSQSDKEPRTEDQGR